MTYRDTLNRLDAVRERYQHINGIPDLESRVIAARHALVELVPPDERLSAEHLAGTVEQGARASSEAFVQEQIRAVARHFPGLELAIMAVYHDHVSAAGAGPDACGCPAGARSRD